MDLDLKGRQLRRPHSLLQSCLLLFVPRKQTLATEEMQGKGRQGLIGRAHTERHELHLTRNLQTSKRGIHLKRNLRLNQSHYDGHLEMQPSNDTINRKRQGWDHVSACSFAAWCLAQCLLQSKAHINI